ncbi:MAG: ABC transporter substrate-binding protein [Rhodocyclaceae bacterium]|nr:ABC transporter substrate-binding protein [Rhodocyclaceae bacterium]
MNARRRTILAMAAALACPGLAWARRLPSRRLRISAVTYRGRTRVEDGFEAYLAARGMVAEILWHDIARDPGRLPDVVARIRGEAPDLVYTWGTTVSLGVLGPFDGIEPARHVTDVPAVFTLVADPVGARLVPSMATPGRALTGVSHMAPLEAQLRAMASYRAFEAMGVIYSPTEKNARLAVAGVEALGRRQGFAVLTRPFPLDDNGRPDGTQAGRLVDELRRAGAQWLYLPPDSFLTTVAPQLLARATEIGLPSFASTEALVRAGALTGIVSGYEAVGQFTAFKAEQILLQGRAPASIPVETLSRFSLPVNLPVARRLGLPPPLAMFDYAELLDDQGGAR